MTQHNPIKYDTNNWILIEKSTGSPKLNADASVKFYATWEQANETIEEFKTLGYYFQAVPLA